MIENKEVSDSIELESSPCPVSGTLNDELIFKAYDKFGVSNIEFNIVKSKDSGLIRINPRPKQISIGKYYPENYPPYMTSRIKPASSFFKKLKVKINDIFDLNRKRLPSIRKGNALEVGCASGEYMNVLKKNGWQVEGLEYSKKAASNAIKDGFKVHIGPIEEVKLDKEVFDIIVAWMVLEHTHEPVIALNKLSLWAKSDSLLVFSVPDASSFMFKLFKGFWYDLESPIHLFHFTPTSIKNILEEGGWQLLKIHHHRTLGNLMASIGNLLTSKGLRGSLVDFFLTYPTSGGVFNYVFFPIAYILSLLGQTGRMTVWAKKKTSVKY